MTSIDQKQAQQQAPAIFEGQSRFACPFQNGCEDGDGFCEYPCEKWLDWHDAAIVAQAVTKQRYRVIKKLHGECDEHCDGCILCDNSGGCIVENTKQAARARKEGYAEGAAAERERVLKDLRSACVSRSWVDSDGDSHYGALTMEEIEESPRSQPEKQQEPDHDIIANKVYPRPKHCTPCHQTEPEYGACTGPDPLDSKIAKLEKMEGDAIQRYNAATTKNEETYQQGIAFGLNRAISELRQQVKK